MQDESHRPESQPAAEAVEPRGARLRRHGHHTRLYAWAFILVTRPVSRVFNGMAMSLPLWAIIAYGLKLLIS